MNWNAIGAVGEVVGAAAVVVSIIYLAIQIRQNTLSTKIRVEQEVAKSMAGSVLDLAATDFPHVYVRGSEDVNQLTDEEAAQFGFYVVGMLRLFQHAYDQRCDGNLSDRTWESIQNSFISQYQSPGVQAVWTVRSNTFKKDFQNYVDSIEMNDDTISSADALSTVKAEASRRREQSGNT